MWCYGYAEMETHEAEAESLITKIKLSMTPTCDLTDQNNNCIYGVTSHTETSKATCSLLFGDTFSEVESNDSVVEVGVSNLEYETSQNMKEFKELEQGANCWTRKDIDLGTSQELQTKEIGSLKTVFVKEEHDPDSLQVDLSGIVQQVCAKNDIVIEEHSQQNIKNHSGKQFEASAIARNAEDFPHQCPKCGKFFKKKLHLNYHVMTHSEERKFVCETCGKGFKLSSYLSAHRRIHRNEKVHKCDECGKSFLRAYHLRVHILTHSEERPYECQYCDKKFRQIGSLNTHLGYFHSEETFVRPFECTLCYRKFRQQWSLNNHMETHTNQDKIDGVKKELSCPECGKAFTWKNALNRHRKTHFLDYRPYQCESCEKTFTRKSDLNVHNRIHTGELPYQCPTCGKRFRNASNVRSHIKVGKCV